MSFKTETLRQRALLEALRPGAEPAAAARLRERGEALGLGLGAYRAHAAATAARALQAAYPTVAAMVGEEALASLARALWRVSPPRCGDLAQWGLDLPEFIESRRDLDPWPYLADAARLDAAIIRCESATDAEPDPASLERLARHDPARLRLRLLPCVQLLASHWPIATLHAAHRRLAQAAASASAAPSLCTDDDTVLAPARQALAAGRAETVVVARAGWRAVLHEIEAPALAWMQALQEHCPLDVALARAGSHFDLEAWLRQALLQGWLQHAEVCGGGEATEIGTNAIHGSLEEAARRPVQQPGEPPIHLSTSEDPP